MINYKVNDNNKYLPTEGGTLSGDLNMNGRLIKNVASPVDDSDIVNYSTLNTKLASTDPYKVGDILYTARTDLGDKWALCNGNAVNPDTDIDNLDSFKCNITKSWDKSCSINFNRYYLKINNIWYSYIISTSQFQIIKFTDLINNKYNVILTSTLGSFPSGLAKTDFYYSDDGYININFGYPRGIYRFNISTKQFINFESYSSSSDVKHYFCSKKINGKYYTGYMKSYTTYYLYSGDTFGSQSTTLWASSTDIGPLYYSYYDNQTNKLFIPGGNRNSGNSSDTCYTNIMIINLANNSIEQKQLGGCYSKYQQGTFPYLTSGTFKDPKNRKLYFSMEEADTSNSGGQGYYSTKYSSINLDTLEVTMNLSSIGSITLDNQIVYFNGYYYRMYRGSGGSSSSILSLYKSTTFPVTISTSTEIVQLRTSAGGGYYDEQDMTASFLFLSNSQCFYYNKVYNNSSMSSVQGAQYAVLPTISSDKSYVYIKVKE